MVALMVLFGALEVTIEHAPLLEAAGIGFYQGGISAIYLMGLYVFWRGFQTVMSGQ